MNKDWKVFQTDVLDLLRQYRGFFDSFERVGSLSDNSRPDAFARITREEKKEVWIIDAKNKSEITEEEEKRMQKYIDQISRNPTDIGLELSELSDHQIKALFITPSQTESKYEVVEFQRLHQYLQKELIYTDTDKIVRDVAKMAERRELSQSQARLLNKSLQPFRTRLESVRSDLKELEAEFAGLNLFTPPFESLDFSPPTDAVIKHQEREGVFLIDIPYSPKEAEKAEKRAKKMEQRIDEKAYYISIHNFNSHSNFSCPAEKFRERLTEELGLLSASSLAEMYEPKFQVRKTFEDGKITLRSDLGFHVHIKSINDIQHTVEASINQDAINRIKDRCKNTHSDFGNFEGTRWTQKIKVTENRRIKHKTEEKLEDYRQKVNNIFQSAVNPVYSKKIAQKVEKR